MFSQADFTYMERALALAVRGLYTTDPNPRVGCVLVKDGVVIGEGFTQPAGHDHAEIQALRDARARGHEVRGATAYVTLEPCSHFGRTPPCANALIEAKVARVIAAMEDPNPLVSGRGLSILRDAGVYFAPSAYDAGFVSSAHDDALIDETIAAARRAFAEPAAQ